MNPEAAAMNPIHPQIEYTHITSRANRRRAMNPPNPLKYSA